MDHTMTIDVARARAETPGVEHRIHFNNCGASLMPLAVVDAVKTHFDLETRIGGYEAADAAEEKLEHAYDAVARLLNCSRDEVALVENATRGWDMAFYAFDFKPGDRILTAVAEYASNYIAFLQVARKSGAVVEAVPNDAYGQLDVNALENMIDERVKLISVVHVPTNGGLVNPVEKIGAVARAHGIPFLLDACQSAGQMPLDVETLHVDMLTATGRKYLRGPRGTGFLYVRRSLLKRLEPPFLDLQAATWTRPNEFNIRNDARRFETWERHAAGQIGLGVAVDYALEWGLEAIQKRIANLAQQLRKRLTELPYVRVHDRGEIQCGIVSFSVDAQPPQQVVADLAKRNINVSLSHKSSTLLDMQQRGLDALIRAGIHYYNNEEEIERFIAALETIQRK